MRKIILCLLGVITTATIAITSCIKSDESTNTKAEILSFESFERYGEIHNDFLTNVIQNFEPSDEINSYDEAIDYVNDFQLEFLKSTNLKEEEKQMLSASLIKTKRLVDVDYSYNKMFPNMETRLKSNSIEEMSLFEIIEKSKEDGLIDNFEYISLKALGEKVKLGFEGIISEDELKTFTLQLKDEWLSKGYTVESANGRIMANTLAISLASLDWWEKNPNIGLKSSRTLKSTLALPAWVGLDIGGAIISGAIAASGQYTLTGEVNWEVVGWSTLGGGVSTSTGAAGKLGKHLTHLTKWF